MFKKSIEIVFPFPHFSAQIFRSGGFSSWYWLLTVIDTTIHLIRKILFSVVLVQIELRNDIIELGKNH